MALIPAISPSPQPSPSRERENKNKEVIVQATDYASGIPDEVLEFRRPTPNRKQEYSNAGKLG